MSTQEYGGGAFSISGDTVVSPFTRMIDSKGNLIILIITSDGLTYILFKITLFC